MQNVCNTNSRILIQQSGKFIFLGILVLGLHPAPDYACGVWTYKLLLGLQRRKQFTQVTRQQQSWT